MAMRPNILFAGGGTGGHIFPSLAIAERLGEMEDPPSVHFVSSDRPLDAKILSEAGADFTPLSVRPLPTRPWHIPGFFSNFWRSTSRCKKLLDELNIGVVVTMGGFVSGPAIRAAKATGRPSILVNLDAVPGKANRWLSHFSDHIYSCFKVSEWGNKVQLTGMPLRRVALSAADPATNKKQLGLDQDKPVLLITGASQGAASINQMMMALVDDSDFHQAMDGWQILHLAGADQDRAVAEAYQKAKIPAKVVAFCDQMGCAWGAADLAISRAGAGSVAEVAANAVPAIFLPYPFHKDEHQRLNAEPLVQIDGAVMTKDHVQAETNVRQIGPQLVALLKDRDRREAMVETLRRQGPGDGAQTIATEAMRLRV